MRQPIRTEGKLNGYLVKRMKAIWPSADRPMWERIENRIAAGTFDSWIGTGEGSGWVELKACGPLAKPDMRTGQPAFGLRCHAAGVPAHVLCGAPDGYLKLINGWTMGPDWRDHLVMEGHLDDHGSVRDILLVCMGRLKA